MKVLSTVISAAVLAQLAIVPALADTSYSSTSTTTTTTQPAIVQNGAGACAPVMTETCAPATCAPTVITQPAVVANVCENKRVWGAGLGLLALAGIATAIAVPIAVHHHHHHHHNGLTAQQQQLLLFQQQQVALRTGQPLAFNPFFPLLVR